MPPSGEGTLGDAQQGLQVVMLGLVGLSIQAARTESSNMLVIVVISVIEPY